MSAHSRTNAPVVFGVPSAGQLRTTAPTPASARRCGLHTIGPHALQEPNDAHTSQAEQNQCNQIRKHDEYSGSVSTKVNKSREFTTTGHGRNEYRRRRAAQIAALNTGTD
jgi:hypothetical protein